jgi:hypothetical protein
MRIRKHGFATAGWGPAMTLQTYSQSVLAATGQRRRRSFWQRLLRAIMQSQQRKAEQVLQDYPPASVAEGRDGFSRDLERWFVGR